MRRSESAFTLIEMMAVMLLVVAVTGVALNGYIDLSGQSLAAADLTRDARRATAILDRVARDLEAARLAVKPAEMDPLEHPWLFLAEARSSRDGAERLKFVTLGQAPIASQALAGDLAQVAWLTRRDAGGEMDLLRWSEPRLPEGLDRRFPRDGDDGVFLVAEGLAGFGVRFMDDAGEWVDEWDSSTLARSSELPLVAEISVSIATGSDEVAGPFERRVVLPMRAMDLAARLSPGDEATPGEGEEEAGTDDPSCLRVRDCVDVAALTPDLMNVVFDLMDQCLADTGIPDSALLPECL